jgi:pimeloyl-ACP methyl ester carboxylesterase
MNASTADTGSATIIDQPAARQLRRSADDRMLDRFAHTGPRLMGSASISCTSRPAAAGIPLVLGHSWPSCFIELLPLVPLLTDPAAHGIDGPAFDVMIPSLPGYGFSVRPAVAGGVTYRYVAALWHRLMRGLDYIRYGQAEATSARVSRRSWRWPILGRSSACI